MYFFSWVGFWKVKGFLGDVSLGDKGGFRLVAFLLKPFFKLHYKTKRKGSEVCCAEVRDDNYLHPDVAVGQLFHI